MKLSHYMDTKLDFQVSPLIDIVFLLLIYFMVTASLVKKEADVAFSLPTPGPVEIRMPVEVRVEIAADGAIEVEGMRFSRDDRSLNELVTQIAGLKEIAAAQQSEFFVNITPHKKALHRRVIDVMDACSAAGVDQLNFGRSI
ncbi:MAG: hypothetical protein DRP64_17460 [Verrucomicrobia bacterium]|nr:MAG: hypothetical protein DRP64_17460 [Verrucomicrobiota bacterium]